ncbi:MAG TPA: transporter [Candidatus Polarisedimenticolia bacterium]|nr:transporter [Candidatus Polarisedimenticolia bacterium]
MGMIGRLRLAAALLALGAGGIGPAMPAEAPPPIRDNSFLVEEAYNQEAKVVQHISSFLGFGDDRDWLYAFTQEWPLGGQAHQLSYTLALADPGCLGGETGAGDTFVNYRYQVAGGGPERVAFAPRASLLLPTGNVREGRGRDAFGVFVNLPLSVEYTPALVGHYNAGAGRVFSAKDAAGGESDLTDFFLAQSLVWLARPTFNVMLEAVWASEEEVVGPGVADRSSSLLINPGLRWAINRPSGLQIVPGIAVPIGLGPSRGEEALFLYLSFEHAFARDRSE